jgi:hypothetical protein
MCTALALIFSIEMISRKRFVCRLLFPILVAPTHGGADHM